MAADAWSGYSSSPMARAKNPRPAAKGGSKVTPINLTAWVKESWNKGPRTPGRKEWTKHMNRRLARLAKEHMLEEWCSGRGRKRAEYLVDHCWSNRWQGMASYTGLVFAAEFEFHGSRASVEEDLVKLADVRADARLFLGNLRGRHWEKKAETIAQAAAEMLAIHAHTRSDWIVLALGPKGKKLEGEQNLMVWKVTSRGPVRM